jgi:hypothetical protein
MKNKPSVDDLFTESVFWFLVILLILTLLCVGCKDQYPIEDDMFYEATFYSKNENATIYYYTRFGPISRQLGKEHYFKYSGYCNKAEMDNPISIVNDGRMNNDSNGIIILIPQNAGDKTLKEYSLNSNLTVYLKDAK